MSIEVFNLSEDRNYLLLKIKSLRIGWYQGFKTGIKVWRVRD